MRAGRGAGSVRPPRSNSEHGPPLMDQTVVLCTLAAFLLYYNTLHADFAYDDRYANVTSPFCFGQAVGFSFRLRFSTMSRANSSRTKVNKRLESISQLLIAVAAAAAARSTVRPNGRAKRVFTTPSGASRLFLSAGAQLRPERLARREPDRIHST